MLMLNEEYDYFGGIVDDGEFAFVRFTKKVLHGVPTKGLKPQSIMRLHTNIVCK